jgi:uncharacterized membrane protein YgaE (UPF0421/DUF939 family)
MIIIPICIFPICSLANRRHKKKYMTKLTEEERKKEKNIQYTRRSDIYIDKEEKKKRNSFNLRTRSLFDYFKRIKENVHTCSILQCGMLYHG